MCAWAARVHSDRSVKEVGQGELLVRTRQVVLCSAGGGRNRAKRAMDEGDSAKRIAIAEPAATLESHRYTRLTKGGETGTGQYSCGTAVLVQ
jgi:hypothetical protein